MNMALIDKDKTVNQILTEAYLQGYNNGIAKATANYHKAVENNLRNATFDDIVNDNIAKQVGKIEVEQV